MNILEILKVERSSQFTVSSSTDLDTIKSNCLRALKLFCGHIS